VIAEHGNDNSAAVQISDKKNKTALLKTNPRFAKKSWYY
jgi:hypothetical protein